MCPAYPRQRDEGRRPGGGTPQPPAPHKDRVATSPTTNSDGNTAQSINRRFGLIEWVNAASTVVRVVIELYRILNDW